MADISFEELVEAAHKLTPEQKAALVHSLQPDLAGDVILTREQALAELEALRAAGAFKTGESLCGKYAASGVEVSDEELNAYLREIGSEWEHEPDDLINDN